MSGAAPPEAARELFGPKLAQAEAYAALLVGAGVERGLIGPAEAGRIWDRHLINSGLVVELLPVCAEGSDSSEGRGGSSAGAGSGGSALGGEAGSQDPAAAAAMTGAVTGRLAGRLADLGSGAGLPGMVLAILRPELRVTLVEPMARRTAFLAECVNELGLGNVEICRGRAEDLAGVLQADVVTSRAVARLDRLAVLAVGVCRPGGLVLAIKGASAAAELDEARSVLGQLGAVGAEVVTAGRDFVASGLIEQPTTVVRFRTASRAGAAAKRHRGGGRGGGSGAGSGR